MQPGQLHHIELYVEDLEETVDFWDWLLKRLGYRDFQEWDGGRSWRLGETYLVFVQASKPYVDRSFHRCEPGLNHLAFHARSEQDVDRLTRQLRERDVPILYEDRHPHAGGQEDYAVYFEDPNRLKVEVVAPSAVEPDDSPR